LAEVSGEVNNEITAWNSGWQTAKDEQSIREQALEQVVAGQKQIIAGMEQVIAGQEALLKAEREQLAATIELFGIDKMKEQPQTDFFE
jgi:uncharacterized coiled-coil protein SlyX